MRPFNVGARIDFSEPHRRHCRGWRIWILGKPERCLEGKVVLLVHDGIVSVRVLFVTFGQHHDRAELLRSTPPLGQGVALNLDVLDVSRVLRFHDRRQSVIEGEPDAKSLRRIEMHFDRPAHEVARGIRPALTLPMILVSPDRMPIGAMILSIDVEHSLGVVVAGREFTHATQGITDRVGIERRPFTCLEPIDVYGEKWEAPDTYTRRLVGSHTGLNVVLHVKSHKNPSGDRLIVQGGGKADLEPSVAAGTL